jgi:hypothetical protein
MGENQQLGLAGAPFREGDFQYDYRYTNIENVWGGCQLFRRECFETIGGYTASEGGCIDHMAVLSARMHGWQTRTFTERVCVHHRRMGTAMQGGLKAKFRHGGKDYLVRNHPLWQLFRACYQMKHPPLMLGGIAVGAGYAWALLARRKTPLSPEMVAFARRDQMKRLKRLVVRRKPKQAIPGSRLDSPAGLLSSSHAGEESR